MKLEMQRDELNGNVWDWKDVSHLFHGVQSLFENNPLLESVTMSYSNVEMRFRKGKGS